MLVFEGITYQLVFSKLIGYSILVFTSLFGKYCLFEIYAEYTRIKGKITCLHLHSGLLEVVYNLRAHFGVCLSLRPPQCFRLQPVEVEE